MHPIVAEIAEGFPESFVAQKSSYAAPNMMERDVVRPATSGAIAPLQPRIPLLGVEPEFSSPLI